MAWLADIFEGAGSGLAKSAQQAAAAIGDRFVAKNLPSPNTNTVAPNLVIVPTAPQIAAPSVAASAPVPLQNSPILENITRPFSGSVAGIPIWIILAIVALLAVFLLVR